MYCIWALLLLLLAVVAVVAVSDQEQSDPHGQYSRVARKGALTIIHTCTCIEPYKVMPRFSGALYTCTDVCPIASAVANCKQLPP